MAMKFAGYDAIELFQIATTYIAEGDYSEAVSLLRRASSMDDMVRAELSGLLASCEARIA